MAEITGSNQTTVTAGTSNAAVGSVPSVLGAEIVSTGATTTPVTTAIPSVATAVPSTVTTGIPSVLQTGTATSTVATGISTTGIPPGWNVKDYEKDYSAEYNRIKAVNPNDPRLPVIAAARAEKIKGMPDYTVKAGDTLSQIAKAHKTSVAMLQSINPSITDPNKIAAGQAIKVPTAAAIPTTTPTTTAGKAAGQYALGTLSGKYESNGNPGAISTGAGDLGGKSYGTYQFASKMGTVNSFMDYLKTANPSYYQKLYAAYTQGGVGFGANFDNAWKQIASSDPKGFEQLQHNYIQTRYYDPAAAKLKAAGIDVSQHSAALQNALWSTAVQHGVNGAVNIFKKIDTSGSDAQILKNLYAERGKVDQYFSGSSSAVRAGVANRFKNELKDALGMLATEQAQPATPTTPTTPTTTPTTGVPTALSGQQAASTKSIASTTTQPTNMVGLADELKKRGLDVQWDAATGNILVNGTPLTNDDIKSAQIYEGHTYVPNDVIKSISKKFGVTTPPTDIGGKTYTNEATGEPWNVDDYKQDYSAEINRIQKIDPADPRLDVLLKARAEKIKNDPTLYADPNNKRWADDILAGVWDVRDYEKNYQAEINKLRKVDPSDPRIDILEHARAKQILADKSSSQSDKDWAIDVDKRNWKVDDYKENLQAEIDRIKAFNPNDPRIEELSDARAIKILNNPGAYDADTVKWAQTYESDHADRLAQKQLAQSYMEAEAQSDIQTRRTAKQILDYYKSVGLKAGGQAAAAIAQAAMAGKGELATLEQQRTAASAQLLAQQQAAKAEQAVAEAKAKVEAAKTDAELQIANINLQKAQISLQQSNVNLAKAQTAAATAASKASSSSSKATTEKAAAKGLSYTAYLKQYQQELDSIGKVSPGGLAGLWPGNWIKDPDKVQAVIDEINGNQALTSAQKSQMLKDLKT